MFAANANIHLAGDHPGDISLLSTRWSVLLSPIARKAPCGVNRRACAISALGVPVLVA